MLKRGLPGLVPTLIYFISVTPSFGQLGFQQGTITKKDGTVINCFVEMQVGYGPKVYYKMEESSYEKVIKSTEVKSIQLQHRKFDNIQLEKKEQIMALMAEGKLILYTYVNNKQGSRKSGYGGTFAMFEPEFTHAIIRDGILTELTNDNYKERLSKLVEERKDLVDRINDPDFKITDVEQVVIDYNG